MSVCMLGAAELDPAIVPVFGCGSLHRGGISPGMSMCVFVGIALLERGCAVLKLRMVGKSESPRIEYL